MLYYYNLFWKIVIWKIKIIEIMYRAVCTSWLVISIEFPIILLNFHNIRGTLEENSYLYVYYWIFFNLQYMFYVRSLATYVYKDKPISHHGQPPFEECFWNLNMYTHCVAIKIPAEGMKFSYKLKMIFHRILCKYMSCIMYKYIVTNRKLQKESEL